MADNLFMLAYALIIASPGILAWFQSRKATKEIVKTHEKIEQVVIPAVNGAHAAALEVAQALGIAQGIAQERERLVGKEE